MKWAEFNEYDVLSELEFPSEFAQTNVVGVQITKELGRNLTVDVRYEQDGNYQNVRFGLERNEWIRLR